MNIGNINPINRIWKHSSLIKALSERDVLGRYRGASLGVFWSLFNPLLMLSVYTFMFGFVFKAKWPNANQHSGGLEYSVIIFSGLMVFNFFSEVINRAPSLITSNTNYVKKVIFPLEILPVVTIISAVFHFIISFSIWLVFYAFVFGSVNPEVILIPLLLAPLVLFTLGLSWLMASLGVYLRDMGQIIAVLTTALMFISPVFYPISALPEEYQQVMRLNPLTPIIENSRAVLINGTQPDWSSYSSSLILSALLFIIGFYWFEFTKKGFADVI